MTKRFNQQIALTALVLSATLLFIYRTTQRGIRIDWDIDTFLVIGQKYLSGQQFYTDFFDPKWPHIQWLYLPGALSGSLMVHQLTSWLAVTLTGLCLTLLALNNERKGKSQGRHRKFVCAGLIYILLTPLLPGGNIGHLEVYSNLLLGAAFLVGHGILSTESRLGKGLRALVAGIFIGFASGIRPNLVISFCLILVFLGCREFRTLRQIGTTFKICIGFAIGIVFPFLSYIRSKELALTAWSGAIGILGDWNETLYKGYSGSSYLSELVSLYSPKVYGFEFYLLLALLVVAIFASSLRQRTTLAAFGFFLYWTGLLVSYRISHIHHHYILLDFFGICVALAYLEKRTARCSRLLLLIVVACSVGYLVRPTPDLSKADQHYLKGQEQINDYLRQQSHHTFAAPELVALHWLNHEPIRTKGIHKVWSIDIASTLLTESVHARRLGLTNSLSEQCDIWTSSKVDIIVMSEELINLCPGSKNYLPVNTSGFDLRATRFRVLKRR